MAHYQQYYNQNLHVLPIQFWYCTSLQWYNTRNTPNLNSFCWNAKMMSFSNLILTLFTYFLYASTMYKHIFGLILVTHTHLGVQLDHNNRFSIIWLSKSNFPTYWRACAQGERERAREIETLNFCEKGWHKVDSGSKAWAADNNHCW